MATRLKCHCQSCTIRGLVGPAIVISLGILWLLNEVHGGRFYFGSTWPVLLIVAGLVHLASSMASRDGHVSSATPPCSPPAPPASDAGTPQTPFSSQGQ